MKTSITTKHIRDASWVATQANTKDVASKHKKPISLPTRETTAFDRYLAVGFGFRMLDLVVETQNTVIKYHNTIEMILDFEFPRNSKEIFNCLEQNLMLTNRKSMKNSKSIFGRPWASSLTFPRMRTCLS